MPGGNRMGPQGMGPRTGRGAGYCSGAGMPGAWNPMSRPGFRMGVGGAGRLGGRGFRRRNRNWCRGYPQGPYFDDYRYPDMMYPYQVTDPEAEKSVLKNQAKSLQMELEDILNRLSELETGSVPEKSE